MKRYYLLSILLLQVSLACAMDDSDDELLDGPESEIVVSENREIGVEKEEEEVKEVSDVVEIMDDEFFKKISDCIDRIDYEKLVSLIGKRDTSHLLSHFGRLSFKKIYHLDGVCILKHLIRHASKIEISEELFQEILCDNHISNEVIFLLIRDDKNRLQAAWRNIAKIDFSNKSQKDFIKYLLDHGVDTKEPLSGNKIPLITLVKSKKRGISFLEIVESILEHDRYHFDIDREDNCQMTALHWAIICNDVSMVKLLVKHGANKNKIMVSSRKTPLMMVVDSSNRVEASGKLAMVEALIGGGDINLNCEDAKGFTALMYAVKGWYMDYYYSQKDVDAIVTTLLDAGADILYKNKNGMNVFDAALKDNGYREDIRNNVIQLLQKRLIRQGMSRAQVEAQMSVSREKKEQQEQVGGRQNRGSDRGRQILLPRPLLQENLSAVCKKESSDLLEIRQNDDKGVKQKSQASRNKGAGQSKKVKNLKKVQQSQKMKKQEQRSFGPQKELKRGAEKDEYEDKRMDEKEGDRKIIGEERSLEEIQQQEIIDSITKFRPGKLEQLLDKGLDTTELLITYVEMLLRSEKVVECQEMLRMLINNARTITLPCIKTILCDYNTEYATKELLVINNRNNPKFCQSIGEILVLRVDDEKKFKLFKLLDNYIDYNRHIYFYRGDDEKEECEESTFLISFIQRFAKDKAYLPLIETCLNGMSPENIDWVNKEDKTALYYAIDFGDYDIVNLLLAHNAAINKVFSEGYESFPFERIDVTPLMLALYKREDKIASLLLDKGAEIIKDSSLDRNLLKFLQDNQWMDGMDESLKERLRQLKKLPQRELVYVQESEEKEQSGDEAERKLLREESQRRAKVVNQVDLAMGEVQVENARRAIENPLERLVDGREPVIVAAPDQEMVQEIAARARQGQNNGQEIRGYSPQEGAVAMVMALMVGGCAATYAAIAKYFPKQLQRIKAKWWGSRGVKKDTVASEKLKNIKSGVGVNKIKNMVNECVGLV